MSEKSNNEIPLEGSNITVDEVEIQDSQQVNLNKASINSVKAGVVRMNQSSSQNIVTSELDLAQGLVGKIEAQNAVWTESITGAVEGARIRMENSANGLIRGEEIQLEKSVAGILVADHTSLTSGRSGIMVGGDIRADQIKTTFLVSRNVNGPVETVFDTQKTLLAGLIAGVVVSLMLFTSKLLTHRN